MLPAATAPPYLLHFYSLLPATTTTCSAPPHPYPATFALPHTTCLPAPPHIACHTCLPHATTLLYLRETLPAVLHCVPQLFMWQHVIGGGGWQASASPLLCYKAKLQKALPTLILKREEPAAFSVGGERKAQRRGSSVPVHHLTPLSYFPPIRFRRRERKKKKRPGYNSLSLLSTRREKNVRSGDSVVRRVVVAVVMVVTGGDRWW